MATAEADRWGPYSGAGDFLRTMAVVLACLLALLAALAAAFRCLLRRRQRRQSRADEEKPAAAAVEMPPAMAYCSAGGEAAECAVCLAELADGDAVRAKAACAHVFHARCIDRWLAAARRPPPVLPDLPRARRSRSCRA